MSQRIRDAFPLDWCQVDAETMLNDSRGFRLGEAYNLIYSPFIHFPGADGNPSIDFHSRNSVYMGENATPAITNRRGDLHLLLPQKLNDRFLEEQRLLCPLGLGLGQALVLEGFDHPVFATAYAQGRQEALLAQISSARLDTTAAALLCYFVGRAESDFARDLGIPILGTASPALFYLLNSKYFLLKAHNLGALDGVHMVEGRACHSVKELSEAIDELFRSHDPRFVNRLLVRSEVCAGAGDINTCQIRRRDIEGTSRRDRRRLLQRMARKLKLEYVNNRCTVQLYLENVPFSFVSTEFIGFDRRIEHRLARTQRFRRKGDLSSYVGSDYPHELEEQRGLVLCGKEQSRSLSQILASLGARGHICNDFVAYPKNFVHYMRQREHDVPPVALTDANVRLYGHCAMNSFVSRFAPEFATIIFARLARPISNNALLAALGELAISSKKQECGVLPYETGMIEEKSRCNFFLMAPTRERIVELEDRLRRTLRNVAAPW